MKYQSYKHKRKLSSWIVSPHAKQRAWERYGVVFSPQKWAKFCATLQKEEYAIRLGSDGSGSCRIACYFLKRWFLVGCSIIEGGGIVATFLPADAMSDTDKSILLSDDRYSSIGDDAWNMLSHRLSPDTALRKPTRLPELHLLQEELPPDFEQIGNLLEIESRELFRR